MEKGLGVKLERRPSLLNWVLFCLAAFEYTLENEELNQSDGGADQNSEKQADAAAFHSADNTNGENEACGAKQSFFDSDSNCRGESRNYCADEGYELVARHSSSVGSCIGNCYCSVISLIISVHINTCLLEIV